MPSDGRATSSIGVVRARISIFSATCAVEIQILRPGQHIMVAAALRAGLEPRRVEPGIGLGHRKTGLFVAGDQRRQKTALLLVGAEDDDRMQPEDVHVDRRGAAEPGAGFGDRLHQHRRLGDAEPAAAIGFRHGDAEPAGLGHRPVKFVRKAALLVLFQPVIVAEAARTAARPRRGSPAARQSAKSPSLSPLAACRPGGLVIIFC